MIRPSGSLAPSTRPILGCCLAQEHKTVPGSLSLFIGSLAPNFHTEPPPPGFGVCSGLPTSLFVSAVAPPTLPTVPPPGLSEASVHTGLVHEVIPPSTRGRWCSSVSMCTTAMTEEAELVTRPAIDPEVRTSRGSDLVKILTWTFVGGGHFETRKSKDEHKMAADGGVCVLINNEEKCSVCYVFGSSETGGLFSVHLGEREGANGGGMHEGIRFVRHPAPPWTPDVPGELVAPPAHLHPPASVSF